MTHAAAVSVANRHKTDLIAWPYVAQAGPEPPRFVLALVQATDAAVQSGLEAAGLRTTRHATYLLHEPADVRIDMGKWCGHFGTLTPFHRCVKSSTLFEASIIFKLAPPLSGSPLALYCWGLQPKGLIIKRKCPCNHGHCVLSCTVGLAFSLQAASEGLVVGCSAVC